MSKGLCRSKALGVLVLAIVVSLPSTAAVAADCFAHISGHLDGPDPAPGPGTPYVMNNLTLTTDSITGSTTNNNFLTFTNVLYDLSCTDTTQCVPGGCSPCDSAMIYKG